ncbi:Protein transport protein SEC31 [Tolypocladium ophioglossoides CBS 100239]|uniref:Protein transport protein SEC31 n=1 Tax=Tolypocladium ophioglossoides (strain CBS 100239) TaxID=1163406 RepID=A0A0L0NK68_TOLOC|nr:Protein transport protein SEC31 [Tolypocladium ophioglossoides CBS 100239]
MVRLREVPRTATFAWSAGPGKPLLVTGTRAGAVDADFSDESKLELWDLALDDLQQGIELQPLASITTDSKFYDIAWSPPDSDHPKGIIAGALENGSLDLWDAARLESGASDALISQTTKHTGAIKTLQFNPLKPQILATAGSKGELFIYDVNDISNPFRLGNAAARSDDIDCLAWNRKVSHILATGGQGGFVTVWDLKTKKASLTLNNSRKSVSAIAWDPNNSTKLLTATPDDSTPVILLWDLRNSNAPEKTLQGHDQGVLSLSWCHQDSDLLLSSGKDNRTLVWNPHTGERYGELPEMTNWTFQTRFNPHNPNLSATASFDGKITIQTLQNTNPDTSKIQADKSLDDEEFFRAAQTQPQGASWSLNKAPKWFERPIGASFGFGGKIIVFKASPAQPGQKRTSKIIISNFSADSDVSSATEKFQEALASGDLASICEERMEQAKTEDERADWKVMETLVGENPRGKIVEYLGFKEEKLTNGARKEPADGEMEADTKPEGESEEKKKEVSDFFGSGDGEGEGDGDDFLSDLAATKGAKIDNPFQLFSDSETHVEKDITRALMLGNFAKATDICLAEERIADAFLIANCGGQELVDKVQSAYLAKKRGMPSYLRLLGSVIAKNLWDVVYNANLENWKETMSILCTFSDPTEFPDLCEALGDRISEAGLRKDASFCYLVGSKLEKVINIWVAELEEAEQAGMKEPSEDSTFSVHARSLQNFIEKVTIFRHVTKFQDSEQGQSSDWKLATLYDKYTEYADILAGHGQLEVAQKYLDLLPSNYPAAEIARSRVRMATKKPAAKTAAARQPAATNVAPSRVQPTFSYQPGPVMPPTNPYGGMSQNQSPVAQPQQFMPPQNPYQPQGGYQPPTQPGYPGGMAPPLMGGPPPRNTTPSQPRPSQSKKMDNWNDVPLVTKAVPRRPTPGAAPITSPFPGQQSPSGPPQPTPYGQRASPPAPPPKGPAPPRVQSPLAGPPQSFQAPPPRPSSSATSQYEPPPPPPQAGAAPSPIPQLAARTASPYNVPPPGPPPSNRYAPAPSAQQQKPSHPLMASMPPPPGPASRPPPANPYGAPPPQATPQGQYAASPYGAPQNQPSAPPHGPPPTGPPRMGGPTQTPPPPKAAAPPPKAKHPPGDRSHIPANAQRLVEALGQDMQRVASKAPATFAPQVKDTQKRLNLLFDHLNNEDLVLPPTIEQLTQLAEAIQSKDYAAAQRFQVEIQRDKTEECGNWMVGVKRLISMSKATP